MEDKKRQAWENEFLNAGGKLANADSLADVLARTYIANVDQAEDIAEQRKRLKKEQDAFKAELATKVEAGELSQEEADDEFNYKVKHKGFKYSKKPYTQVINLLVIGEPGGGKTSIIEQWAENNDIGLVVKTAAEITQAVVRGLPYANDKKYTDENGEETVTKVQDYLKSTFFDELDNDEHEWNVLFVDELNRMYSDAEAGILTLVQDRTINDRNAPGGRHFFDKYLFTIAACNPPSTSKEANNLGMATRTRFKSYIWNSDPKELYDFISENNAYRLELNDDPDNPRQVRKATMIKGRQAILDTIMASNEFKFADPEEVAKVGSSKDFTNSFHVLNARTFMTALESCNGNPGADDSGHMEFPSGSFMDSFRETCTKDAQKIKWMNDILLSLQEDMESIANGYQNTILDTYQRWVKRNKTKYGLR